MWIINNIDYCVSVLADHSSDSDGDHHYEMLHEVVGNVKNDPLPYDDFDSFDSDVSDETYIKPLRQVQEEAWQFLKFCVSLQIVFVGVSHTCFVKIGGLVCSCPFFVSTKRTL